MENKKSKKGLLVVVLLLVAAATVTFGVTYSRYVSNAKGDATATAAKWLVTYEGTDIDETTSLSFSDFAATSASKAEISGSNTKLIAPGFVGTTTIQIKNESEVPAMITVSNGAITGIPATATKTDQITITSSDSTATEIAAGATKTVTLILKWSDNNTDEYNAADTIIGKAQSKITIPVTVKAVQKVSE